MSSEAAWFPSGLAAAFALMGCSGVGGPGPSSLGDESGTYDLKQMNGAEVPVDHGPLPPRFPEETRCHFITEQGALSLDGGTERYMRYTIVRSSCGDRILSNRWSTGRYADFGDVLVLDVGGGVGIEAQIARGTVSLEDQRTFTYLRSAEAVLSSHLLLGTYRLARVRGEELPVEIGSGRWAGVDEDCEVHITEGALGIEAEANGGLEFWLGYSAVDSCTGEHLDQVSEAGTLEHVASSLGFTARISPQIIKRYPGVVQGVALTVFREYDYVFERD